MAKGKSGVSKGAAAFDLDECAGKDPHGVVHSAGQTICGTTQHVGTVRPNMTAHVHWRLAKDLEAVKQRSAMLV